MRRIGGEFARPGAGPWLTALALLWPVACAGGPARPASVADAGRYSRLDDPQGSAAYAAAMTALARGDRAAALVGLRRTVELCPDHVRAHRLYQDVARELGGEAESAMYSYYRQLPERAVDGGASPVPAYVKARLADTSYAQGNALLELLRQHPGFAWGHLSLGRVSRRQGRLLQAIDSFGNASRDDVELAEAPLERAQVLAELGRYEEAARDYERYLRLVPDDTQSTRAYLDLLLYHLRRVDRALELLQPLLVASPRDVELRMHHAAAMWLSQRPRQALDGYLQILEEQPAHARALLNIGLLYYEVLPKDEAEQRRFWPQAALAFAAFLKCDDPQDGHEQFERTVAVPYRLARIATLLGGPVSGQASVEALRWRDS